MRMNLDHVASGGDCEFALAVNMPPTKVCPQCKAAVPVRWKTCERCDHVFRSKRKAECNLREKAMKSARKAKDKLHKACVRNSCTNFAYPGRQEQNRMCMASMRESQGSD